MPQRTNDFQQLVELIHRLFAPQDATVTASALVTSASGQEREIDVLVEFKTELYPVRIAVEAKDLSRPIETTTLEQYIGKYNSQGGVNVDKVIVVAKSFAKPVIDRAQSLGFELHTLTSLASSKVGEFSRPLQGQSGSWWIGKELGAKRVKLTLFDGAGKKLSDIYQMGRLVRKKPFIQLGTPVSWCKNLVDGCLGEQLNNLYQEHAGETIQFTTTIGFSNHTVEATGFRAARLGQIVLDFGEHMKFPDMNATYSKLTLSPTETKTIVHEKGHGKNALLNLVYEDVDMFPSKVQLHAEALVRSEQPLEIRRIEMTIDSEEADAATIIRIIGEASNSW